MAWTPPTAAQLQHRIRIERRASGTDEFGNVGSGSFATVAQNVAAKIAATRGGEKVIADRLAGVSTFDITVRATAQTRDLKPSDRIVDERSGEAFDVLWRGSLDDAARWITIQAQTGAH